MSVEQRRNRLRQLLEESGRLDPDGVEHVAAALDEFLLRDIQVNMTIPHSQLVDSKRYYLVFIERKSSVSTHPHTHTVALRGDPVVESIKYMRQLESENGGTAYLKGWHQICKEQYDHWTENA